MRNILFKNYYDNEEITQINQIHQQYKIYISESIPNHFEIDRQNEWVKPKKPATLDSFDKKNWLNKLVNKSLLEDIKQIISEICTFQDERYNQWFHWFKSIYLNDPTNLLLEELKDWLVTLFKLQELNPQTKIMIQKRRDYLNNLQMTTQFESKIIISVIQNLNDTILQKVITEIEQGKMARKKVICRYYTEKISKELPPQLASNGEKSETKNVVSIEHFNKYNWINDMQNGPLRSYAEDMVADICDYQTKRKVRFPDDEDLNDPINLFLEEFNDWLTRTVSAAPCEPGIKTMAENRLKYLTNIHVSGNFENPLIDLNLRLTNTLQNMLDNKINVEIINSSTRDLLKQLIDNSQAALQHGIEYVYYVLRDTENTPSNCTINNLRDPHNYDLKKVLKTKSGKFLAELINTPLFLKVFPARYPEEENLSSRENKQLTSQSLTENYFLIEKNINNISLPKDLQPLETTTSVHTYLSSPDSGIEKKFSDDKAVIDAFIKLHILFYEIAKFISICEKAWRLAGTGGDLLICGPGKQNMNQLLDACQLLITSIRDNLSLLNHKTHKYYEHLIREDCSSSWMINHKKIYSVEAIMKNDLHQCVSSIESVREKTNSISHHENMRKAQEETGQFISQSENFSKYIYRLLKKPLPENWNINAHSRIANTSNIFNISEIAETTEEANTLRKRTHIASGNTASMARHGIYQQNTSTVAENLNNSNQNEIQNEVKKSELKLSN